MASRNPRRSLFRDISNIDPSNSSVNPHFNHCDGQLDRGRGNIDISQLSGIAHLSVDNVETQRDQGRLRGRSDARESYFAEARSAGEVLYRLDGVPLLSVREMMRKRGMSRERSEGRVHLDHSDNVIAVTSSPRRDRALGRQNPPLDTTGGSEDSQMSGVYGSRINHTITRTNSSAKTSPEHRGDVQWERARKDSRDLGPASRTRSRSRSQVDDEHTSRDANLRFFQPRVCIPRLNSSELMRFTKYRDPRSPTGLNISDERIHSLDSNQTLDSSRVKSPEANVTFKYLKEEKISKTDFEQLTRFLRIRLQQAKERSSGVFSALDSLASEVKQVADSLETAEILKEKLLTRRVATVLPRKTDALSQRSFALFQYVDRCSSPESLASTYGDSHIVSIDKHHTLFVDNEIQLWTEGLLVQRFQNLLSVNRSTCATVINGIVWQVVLYVDVKGSNITLAGCVACLGPDYPSPNGGGSSCGVDVSGSMMLQFQVPNDTRCLRSNFSFVEKTALSMVSLPVEKNVMRVEFLMEEQNLTLESIGEVSVEIKCKIFVREQ